MTTNQGSGNGFVANMNRVGNSFDRPSNRPQPLHRAASSTPKNYAVRTTKPRSSDSS